MAVIKVFIDPAGETQGCREFGYHLTALICQFGLHRYGTEENAEISKRLAKEYIKQGVEANEVQVNEFVGNAEKAKLWRDYFKTMGIKTGELNLVVGYTPANKSKLLAA
jgi:hypothetical protein